MAPRKNVPTTPTNPNDPASEADKIKQSHKLPSDQFNRIVWAINALDASKAIQIGHGVKAALEALGVKRNLSKAVSGIPEGTSQQVNIQNVIRWTEKIRKGDRGAVRQLVALDATCAARTGK